MARPSEQTLQSAAFKSWTGTNANIGMLEAIKKILVYFQWKNRKNDGLDDPSNCFKRALKTIKHRYIQSPSGELDTLTFNELAKLTDAIETYQSFLRKTSSEWIEVFKIRYLKPLDNYLLDVKRDMVCKKLREEIAGNLSRCIAENIERLNDTGKDDMIVSKIFEKLLDLEQKRVYDLSRPMNIWLREAFNSNNELSKVLIISRFFSESTRTMELGYIACAADYLSNNKRSKTDKFNKAYHNFIDIYNEIPFSKMKVAVAKAIIDLIKDLNKEHHQDTFNPMRFVKKLREDNPLTQALKNESLFTWMFCETCSIWARIEEEVLENEAELIFAREDATVPDRPAYRRAVSL